jgi:hypothetical protein
MSQAEILRQLAKRRNEKRLEAMSTQWNCEDVTQEELMAKSHGSLEGESKPRAVEQEITRESQEESLIQIAKEVKGLREEIQSGRELQLEQRLERQFDKKLQEVLRSVKSEVQKVVTLNQTQPSAIERSQARSKPIQQKLPFQPLQSTGEERPGKPLSALPRRARQYATSEQNQLRATW